MTSGAVYELWLEDGLPVTKPGEVLVLPIPRRDYTLRLRIPSTSKILSKGTLHTNLPPRDTLFNRLKFYEHSIDVQNIYNDAFVDLQLWQGGCYSVYFTYNAVEGTYGSEKVYDAESPQWSFVVETDLGEDLTRNGLCVQTVLPKLLKGPVSEWSPQLQAIADKGYNMIHFVPLQPRGLSDSPFSLTDQLGWDAANFPNGEDDVKLLVDLLQEKKIFGLSDLVLNHTASDSEWLSEHPEAGYTPDTAPHMIVAVAVEDALLGLSKLLEGQEINSIDDIENLKPLIRSAIENSKLWEFYVVDVASVVKAVDSHPYEGKIPSNLPGSVEDLAQLCGGDTTSLAGRYHRKVDTSKVAEFVAATDFSASQLVDAVNAPLYAEYNEDLGCIVQQVSDRLRYLRLEGKIMAPQITAQEPLIEPYFTRVGDKALANNGWVWGGNPLLDFAGPESKAYVRREVIIWGDCVKLRYGKGRHDCPYLWDRMSGYARMLATYFSGIRIDNCHSTPLHVGEYILDQARLVRPNLYVVAELFSGSQEMDKLYVERLGIGSLLREAIQPGNPKDFSTVIQVNGGAPIGSLLNNSSTQLIRPEPTHAWLMEVTHDNQMPAQKRTVEDSLSTAGLVAMCQVASGSTMGADECYPFELSVVSEKRPYVFGGGISEAKLFLNNLHREMAAENMDESYTDYRGQYITVHRLNPETGKGVFLIARTAFWHDGDQNFDPVWLEMTKAEFVEGWSLIVDGPGGDKDDHEIKPFKTHLSHVEGIVNWDGKHSTVSIEGGFPQGSVAIFRTERAFAATEIESLVREPAAPAVANLSLIDLNVLLYRCDSEERCATEGKFGVYGIPGYGNLVYAGLQGWEFVLKSIVADNDLGHPLCANLRQGLWALGYCSDRLVGYPQFQDVIEYITARHKAIENVPSFLRPRYFAATLLQLYQAAIDRAVQLIPSELSSAGFVKRLALTSIQMVGKLPNVSLSPLESTPSMAAGLPHFAEGIMRCWGRDVFLSLGGLLLATNRFVEAKQHIIHFGATLKYGLIPNLLDSGRNPRYNARDAAWFFVQSVQDFCRFTESFEILHTVVKRRFPLDDTFIEWDSPQAFQHTSTVGELVFEVVARHAGSITFREHNAGSAIDMHMKDNGFNQHHWVDWENGFIFGGNQDNCGTWQDKMGESVRACSEGVPGTPRDGAAIEIIGLLKSCLRWMNATRRSGDYAFPEEVTTQHGQKISTEAWEELVQKSFEKAFWVPLDPADDTNYDVDSSLVNRRGIYKDLYRTGKPYEDYQLRANFPIAVVAAPELFDVKKVTKALATADDVLRGPVGMATLDPSDWNYRPYYINGEDSDDFATAKGRNYHQGPEWIWPTGFFLRAIVMTDLRRSIPPEVTLATFRNRIQDLNKWLLDSPWAGLTELTQKDGQFCPDSSPTQAWSTAQLIEAITSLPHSNA